MAQSVKLSDGSYIDTEGIYDATQGRTQAALNANKCGKLHLKECLFSNVNYGKSYFATYTPISAPAVDGYTFFCWMAVDCDGAVGAPWIGQYGYSSAGVYDPIGYSKVVKYRCWALYIKND